MTVTGRPLMTHAPAAAIASLLFLLLALGGTASAHVGPRLGASSIGGSITDGTGAPVTKSAGLFVTAFKTSGVDEFGQARIDHVETLELADGQSSFLIGDLAPGTYALKVQDSYARFGTWFNGGGVSIETSTPLVLTESEPQATVNVQLQPSSWVSGTVQEASGQPLDPRSRLAVMLVSADPRIRGGNGKILTGGRSNFEIPVLIPGDWYITVEDDMGIYQRGEYRTPGSSTRSTITVAPGQTIQGLQIFLDRGGQITGVILGCDTGHVGSCVCVSAYPTGGDRAVGSGCAFPPSGEFTIGGLPTGTYQVGIGQATVGGFWYPYSIDRDRAATVRVTAGETTQIAPQQKTPTFTVQGLVSAPPDRPFEPAFDSVCVRLEPQTVTGSFKEACLPPGTYDYRLSGVPLGRYYVSASPSRSDRYARTWFPGVPNAVKASVIEVSSDTTGLDVELLRYSKPTIAPEPGPARGVRLANVKEAKRAVEKVVAGTPSDAWIGAPTMVVTRNRPVRLAFSAASTAQAPNVFIVAGTRRVAISSAGGQPGQPAARAIYPAKAGIYPLVFQSRDGSLRYLRLLVL